MEQTEVMIGGEIVEVDVAGDDYETAITLAMDRFKQFVPGYPIFRNEDEVPDDIRVGWFVAGIGGRVSPGGAQIGLRVIFRRHENTRPNW